MNILLRSLSVVAVLGSVSVVNASAAEIKGILMDKQCAPKAELRIVPPPKMMEGGRVVAEAHTRECLLMPECVKSGYVVYTNDDKFLTLDPAGSRKAEEAIKASKKLDDFEVVVTGEVHGDTIKVESLKIL
jgi:hypothetical protein